MDKLQFLKIDLGIKTNRYDDRLTEYINFAEAEITREGITLADTDEDNNLIVMYASWLWSKRDTGEGMPRMLRYALNNRLFGGHLNG